MTKPSVKDKLKNATLNTTTALRTKSKNDYHSHDLILDPKKESTKLKYMKIYEMYCIEGLLIKEIAVQEKMDPAHACEIIKWCVHQFDNEDTTIRKRAMCDKLRVRQRDLELQLDETDKAKVKVMIYAELRKTDRLIAEFQGMISNAVIDMSDRRQVNMQTSPEMAGRRKGANGSEGSVSEKTAVTEKTV